MALIAMEGFEQFNPNGFQPVTFRTDAVTYGRTVTAAGNANSSLVAGRLGGTAMRCLKTAAAVGVPLGGSKNEVFTGFAFRYTSTSADSDSILLVRQAGQVRGIVTVKLNKALGSLDVYRDQIDGASPPAFATGPSGRLQPDTWYYIEARITVDAGAVSAELRVNSLPYLSASTGPSTFTSFNLVEVGSYNPFFSATTPQRLDFDDWYVLDATGASLNTFLGDCQVEEVAITGTAVANTFTGVGAGTVHGAVSESGIDFDSSYATALTVGSSLLLTPDALSVKDYRRIYAVEVNAVSTRTNAAALTVRTVIGSGIAESLGPATSAQDGAYLAVRGTALVDPLTGLPWSESALNSATFGVRIATRTAPSEYRVTRQHIAVLQAGSSRGARPTIHTTIIGTPL